MRRPDRVSPAALLLVLLALAMRLAVPQGYMLSSEPGLPRITLCTGQGAIEMAIDAQGQLVDPPEGSKHAPTGDEKPCPFAVGQTLALDLDPVAATAPFAYAAVVSRIASSQQRPGLGLAAPPPPSHAPPSLLS